jgi:hypothetical protein
MRTLPGIAAAAALLMAPLAATGARAAEGEWQPWTQLEGSIVNSLPDCLMQGRRIDCWARSTAAGNPLIWNSSPDGDTWSGWENLGGTLRVGPKCVEHAGRFDCFGATQPVTGSQLAHLSYDDDERGEWVILTGGPAVDQRPSCVTGPGQTINCFVTTTADEFWRVELDKSGEWSWEEVSIAGLRSEHRPECVARTGGIDCFIIETIRPAPGAPATARNLWTRRLDKDGWGEWEPLASDVGEPPHCLVSGVKLDCFSRTGLEAPFQLISATYNGRDWSQWIPRGGNVMSQPYCNKLGGGFDCYWTSPSPGELWRSGGDETAWSAPENLGGTIQLRPVCLANPGAPRIDCFALGGPGNTLHQRSRD